MILELLVDLTIAAEGNLEKLSIATKRYDFALELLKNGPAKSSWTSSFAAVGSSCFSNLCFGISDFKFLPVAWQCEHASWCESSATISSLRRPALPSVLGGLYAASWDTLVVASLGSLSYYPRLVSRFVQRTCGRNDSGFYPPDKTFRSPYSSPPYTVGSRWDPPLSVLRGVLVWTIVGVL